MLVKRILRRASACLAMLLVVPALSTAAPSIPYANPFDDGTYYTGRTDMGVDFCLHRGDPIRAVGDGTVIGIQHDWAGGQPYLWYQLTGGPHSGDYVYIAEQITHLVHPGAAVARGQVIARYAKKGTCIETGWATASGETLASATTGYTEGQVTKAGVSFARFLMSLGVDVRAQADEAEACAGQASPFRATRALSASSNSKRPSGVSNASPSSSLSRATR
jgi:peptidase M23-like protein